MVGYVSIPFVIGTFECLTPVLLLELQPRGLQHPIIQTNRCETGMIGGTAHCLSEVFNRFRSQLPRFPSYRADIHQATRKKHLPRLAQGSDIACLHRPKEPLSFYRKCHGETFRVGKSCEIIQMEQISCSGMSLVDQCEAVAENHPAIRELPLLRNPCCRNLRKRTVDSVSGLVTSP